MELARGCRGGGVDDVSEVLEKEDGMDGEMLHGEMLHGEMGVGLELVGGARDRDGVLLHLDEVGFGTEGLKEIWIGLEVEAIDGHLVSV